METIKNYLDNIFCQFAKNKGNGTAKKRDLLQHGRKVQ